MSQLIKTALDKKILTRSMKIAIIVGTLLALINHFDSIVTGDLSGLQIFKIIITYTVPFGVSTYSQVMQRMEQENKQ